MSYDEATVLKIKAAHDKYTSLYDNEMYIWATGSVRIRDGETEARLGVCMSDCALLLCGHPTVQQERWLDLYFLLNAEYRETGQKVFTFLNKFRSDVV